MELPSKVYLTISSLVIHYASSIVVVLVIAGQSMGLSSPVRTRTPTYYLDFRVSPGAPAFRQVVPAEWTTFAYTLGGTAKFGMSCVFCNVIGTWDEQRAFFFSQGPDRVEVPPHHTAVFLSHSDQGAKDSLVEFENAGDCEAHFLLIAGARRSSQLAFSLKIVILFRPAPERALRSEGPICHEHRGRADGGLQRLQKGKKRVREGQGLEVEDWKMRAV